ncbi:MAG: arginyl-tRNA synthetase [Frankiaceae bacterium]|nr:arginyl-tRNA synthetase [Frankiaceae bacterium]
MTPADLAAAVVAAVAAAVEGSELAVAVPETVTVERPRSREHGDYATNVALKLAKPARRPPRDVAEILAAHLRTADGVAAVEVAGPGFLNIRLDAVGRIAAAVVEAGETYGRNSEASGETIDLEFVSANPTGPIHLGGTRWAAVGDALARVLQASGAEVAREYYFNDAGVQIDRFAASLDAAARGAEVPEDGYAGGYISEIAQQVVAGRPGLLEEPEEKRLDAFRRDGVESMFDSIKADLHAFGVDFDVYFSERTLHESGQVDAAVARLQEQGHTYSADGALWLRTTDFGDDKDRVLVKSDGTTTYFTADAAYYLDKRSRGFDRCVYMLGADHHGYVARLKALAACAGDDPQRNIEILIGQLVSLVRDGEPVRMSKRAGTVITLNDLVDAVGVDAARYSLVRSSIDSTLELDLAVLARQTNDNPVFYVQYAHARIASLLRNAAEFGVVLAAPHDVDVSLLTHDRESDLLRSLGDFPRVVASAAELRAPHRIARHLEELAGTYHRFYDACRVLPPGLKTGEEPANELTYARLLLVQATQVVLRNGLGLLGVSAPERM